MFVLLALIAASGGAAPTGSSVAVVCMGSGGDEGELAKLGALASHELVAGLLADGKDAEARAAAGESVRRFGATTLDRRLLPPKVWEMFAAAQEATPGPSGKVTITSTRPAMAFAGARELGLVGGEKTFELEYGTYDVCVRRQDQMSLLHRVAVGAEPRVVRIDLELESRLAVGDGGLEVDCAVDCEPLLRRLGAVV